MTTTDLLRSSRDRILQLAAHHGARNVRIFGSAVRGEAKPESDIDFLVDMEGGRSLLDLIELGQDLEELLHRKVEILTEGGLSPYLQERIHAEAVPL
jgi:predicted nucleotidyltransferase